MDLFNSPDSEVMNPIFLVYYHWKTHEYLNLLSLRVAAI